MEPWEKDQDELNALKNSYHLTWCFEYDLTSIGGILWYKANGAFLGCTSQDPREALPQLKDFVKDAALSIPTYCRPLNKTIMLQGSPQPGLADAAFGRPTRYYNKPPHEVDLEYLCMIPIAGHPGSFGAVRKNHIHEGVDLYANDGDRVYAMVTGKVVAVIEDFTGSGCGMPWWNDTSALAIEDENGVWIYGEIKIGADIKVGQVITKGTDIGGVKQVLKEDKGRPMSMLHLERYTVGTTESVGLWELNTPQPTNLLDPTPELIEGLQLTVEDSE